MYGAMQWSSGNYRSSLSMAYHSWRRTNSGLLPVFLLVVALVACADTSETKSPPVIKKKPECHPCTRHGHCISGYCYGSTCIERGDWKSHSRCLREECAPCLVDSECATRRCHRRRCIFWHHSSFYKCFITVPKPSPSPRTTAPAPLSSPKPQCARCTHHSQCRSGSVCSGSPRVCHDDSPRARRACFRPECALCLRSSQCASARCEGGRCVYNSKASRARCLPGGKPECALCDKDRECLHGKCAGKPPKCVDGSYASRRRCFGKRECSFCRGGHDCAQGKCVSRRCTDGTPESLLKCGLRPSSSPSPSLPPSPRPRKRECTPCGTRDECKEGLKCYRDVCTSGSKASLTRCGFKPMCAKCRSHSECSTRSCTYGMCVDRGYDNLVQCGLRRECDSCKLDIDCATGYCKNSMCVFETSPKNAICYSIFHS